MIHSIIFIILAYLLGSIPFGYLITRLFIGKNILEIGWKKTSGSNVFKNVGKLQGTLTGVLDIFKGWLAVWLAQYFGLSPQIQALCGVAAVTGHNWSCFLRFAGGRGIGTLMGALFALSPVILIFSLIPLIFLTLIWNAAIGTILSLMTAILLFWHYGQITTLGLLPLVSLVPVFLKRLSPLKEIFSRNRKIILNRLIFDNDEALLDLRIKRIIKKLTKK